MLLESEIQLLPDKTALYQLGIFLVVAFVLSHFIFKPVSKIIRLRKTKTEGDRQKVLELNQKAEQLIKEYEGKMSDARKEAFRMKEAIRREGEEQGHRIIQEAKQTGLIQIDKVKKEIAVASQTAAVELESQAKTLSKTLAEKILGRPLGD